MTGEAGGELRGSFLTAMGRLAGGVVVVTSHVGERSWGMTVSACCSLSASPPTMLVSLSRQTASAEAISVGGYYGVSILGKHLLDVAQFGSAPRTPKFIERFCAAEELGARSRSPVVDGALAHVDCRVVKEVNIEDHAIFVGEVCEVLVDEECPEPLVYFNREYHTISSADDRASDSVQQLEIRWWEDIPIVVGQG